MVNTGVSAVNTVKPENEFMPPQKHTPYVFLKSGSFSFPDADVTIGANFRGEPFLIVNLDIETTFTIPSVGGGGTTTMFKPLVMHYKDDHVSMKETVVSANNLVSIISLLFESYFLDLTSLGPYVFPGALRSNHPITPPATFEGLKTINITVSNEDIQNFLERINSLQDEDFTHFVSSAVQLRDAKKSYYRGEDSKSMTEAISAVEALYTRQNPNGFYGDFDSRFLMGTRRETNFQTLLSRTDPSLYTSISPPPYEIRSGYLHAGKIDLYFGVQPREQDEYFRFITGCQKVIVDSLQYFGV